MFLARSLPLPVHLFMAMPDILFYTGLLFYLTAWSSPMDGVGAERGKSSRSTSDLNLQWGFYERKKKKRTRGIVLVASMLFRSVQNVTAATESEVQVSEIHKYTHPTLSHTHTSPLSLPLFLSVQFKLPLIFLLYCQSILTINEIRNLFT